MLILLFLSCCATPPSSQPSCLASVCHYGLGDQVKPLHRRSIVIIKIVIIIIIIIIVISMLSILLGCVVAQPPSGGAADSAEARTLEALRNDYSTRP